MAKNTDPIKYQAQEILNRVFDDATNSLATDLPTGTTISITQNPSDVYTTNDIDSASSTITYMGMEDKDGAWYIKKIDTSTGTVFLHATITNNSSVTTYSDAWTARATLTYGDYKNAF